MPYYIVLVRGKINGMTNWYEFDDADELLDQECFLADNYTLKHVVINGRLSAIDTWNKLFKKARG
ncbi:MAG: hypothetical protein AB9836_04950 [Aminipila sp.]